MKTYKIVSLAGDGIGPEIMNSALRVLKKASEASDVSFDIKEELFGGAGIDANGIPLNEETLEACKVADAILLGAIGGPKWEHATVTPEKGLLNLRKALGLFANVRPTRIMDATIELSPLKKEIVKGCDFVVVRELTGGIYFGEPRVLNKDDALDTCTYTRAEIKRIMVRAFELAKTRKKHVTSVDKANVLATSKLWREVANEVAKEYPEITFEHQLVDSAAMKLITNPTHFDVIVTENLFGDILSDEASVISGSLGMLPSASHSESGPSLYEPIHGSAPDIAGKSIANPMSMILSITMMLKESFKEFDLAKKIEDACDAVMSEGILTSDLGGNASTTQFEEAVISKL